jgi:hypothetical protein
MWSAFPTSDYYGFSVPPRRLQPATDLPSDRTGCPGKWDQRGGSHVHSRTVRRVRCPAMLLRPRHGYAADFHRGLPSSDIYRQGVLRHCADARRFPAQIRQVWSWWDVLRGFQALVPHVHLSVLLAGLVQSGGTIPSRLCRGCCPPSLPFRRSGCPQLLQPAATGSRRCPFITARFVSASWRSRSDTHRRLGAGA